MADFQNHRCFTLRCLGEKVVPVSIKLKSQVKTPKGLKIIKRAEISLLNERIRSINNTINMLNQEKDTCIKKLEEKLDEDLMKECESFIEKRKEARHQKTCPVKRENLRPYVEKAALREVAAQTTTIAAKMTGHTIIQIIRIINYIMICKTTTKTSG